MNPDHPILVGLAGEAGTGKTVTAQGLLRVPVIEVEGQETVKDPIIWSHLFFALPIYRVATIRQKIKGQDASERILFELHEALADIFGRSPIYSPIKTYDEFTSLVRKVASLYCEPEGTKARSFLQNFGSLCRTYDTNIFSEWLRRKTLVEYSYLTEEYPGQIPAIVISDMRYPNEAEMVRNQPNGIIIRLTARPEVLQRRLLDRDGITLTPEQAAHESETSLKNITYFDAVVDSSDMTVTEQVRAVENIIHDRFHIWSRASA